MVQAGFGINFVFGNKSYKTSKKNKKRSFKCFFCVIWVFITEEKWKDLFLCGLSFYYRRKVEGPFFFCLSFYYFINEKKWYGIQWHRPGTWRVTGLKILRPEPDPTNPESFNKIHRVSKNLDRTRNHGPVKFLVQTWVGIWTRKIRHRSRNYSPPDETYHPNPNLPVSSIYHHQQVTRITKNILLIRTKFSILKVEDILTFFEEIT